jgi:hypothetical protein
MDTKKILIAILVILTFLLVGVLALKSFYGTAPVPTTSPLSSLSDSVAEQNARDDQRINDISLLNEKIFASNTRFGGFAFVAGEWENISSEEHPLVLELINNGFMEKPLKDPLPGKYYSYRSDGYTYELRAILENRNSGKCEVLEDQCFYIVKKEMVPAFTEDASSEGFGYEDDLLQ